MREKNTQKYDAGIIGLTPEGVALGVALAQNGLHILCTDMDEDLVSACADGALPGVMPGLSLGMEMVREAERLDFNENVRRVLLDVPVLFINCMVPPSDEERSGLRFLEAIIRLIANQVKADCTAVITCVTPPGTCAAMEKITAEVLAEREDETVPEVTLVAMPLFYADGGLYDELTRCTVLPAGCSRPVPKDLVRLMGRLTGHKRRFRPCTPIEAELAVYTYSGLEIVKETYVNHLKELCSGYNADVHTVAELMNIQERGRQHDFTGGVGYGGSHLPREGRDLMDLAGAVDCKLPLVKLSVAEQATAAAAAYKKITKVIPRLKGKVIAVLGISSVADTDDMREAPALDVVKKLHKAGAKLRVFAPDGKTQLKWRLFLLRDELELCDGVAGATRDADAVVVLGKWKGMNGALKPAMRRRTKGTIFIDLTGGFDAKRVRELGFDYYQ